MDRLAKINDIREKLREARPSIGSWIQIPDSMIAEIMGQGGYDWVAVDMEHGPVSLHQLPDLFRALELGDCLPLARVSQGDERECKAVLDAGAGGIIVPMIETASQLSDSIGSCCWPPAGRRGVGFSRANMFGRSFDAYCVEAQGPLVIAQIENAVAFRELDLILQVQGLDAVMIGPYDLSASLGLTGQFDHPDFHSAMNEIIAKARQFEVPVGIHVVPPSPTELAIRLEQGFTFVAYSLDSVFFESATNFRTLKEHLKI